MCGMEYRLKKGSVYEGKVEKVDFPNKATVWVTDEDGQKERQSSRTQFLDRLSDSA